MKQKIKAQIEEINHRLAELVQQPTVKTVGLYRVNHLQSIQSLAE